MLHTPKLRRQLREGPWTHGVVGERSPTRRQDPHEWLRENLPVFWRDEANGDPTDIEKVDGQIPYRPRREKILKPI